MVAWLERFNFLNKNEARRCIHTAVFDAYTGLINPLDVIKEAFIIKSKRGQLHARSPIAAVTRILLKTPSTLCGRFLSSQVS